MSVTLGRCSHVQSCGCCGVSKKHDGIEEGKVSDEGCRQGRVSDMTGLRFTKEASGRRHPHDTAQLRLWHISQVGNLLN